MNFLRRHVFHDAGLKIFSLIMAVFLWGVVTQDVIIEKQLRAPIELHGMPANLEISSLSLSPAQVLLRGPSRVIERLSSSGIHLEANLANVHPGEETLALSTHNVRVPGSVQVIRIVPAEVRIALDMRKTRVLEVRPRVIGHLASGFSISKVAVQPDH